MDMPSNLVFSQVYSLIGWMEQAGKAVPTKVTPGSAIVGFKNGKICCSICSEHQKPHQTTSVQHTESLRPVVLGTCQGTWWF